MLGRWVFWRSPEGNLHLFGSRLAIGKIERRWQVLISPRLSRGRRWSFGFGPRPWQKEG